MTTRTLTPPDTAQRLLRRCPALRTLLLGTAKIHDVIGLTATTPEETARRRHAALYGEGATPGLLYPLGLWFPEAKFPGDQEYAADPDFEPAMQLVCDILERGAAALPPQLRDQANTEA